MSDVIRLLTVEDANLFQKIRLRAVKEEPTAFLESAEEVAQKSADAIERYFDNGWIAGAFIDGSLVGTCGLFRHKGEKLKHKGTIWGVYVAPEARGKGFARALITVLLEEAARAGIELVHLSTNIENPISTALYQSLGFEAWGVEKHIMKHEGRYIDDVMMIKFLNG
jgi:RimJ/RimL family protein N-acetyltransferase